MNNRAAAQSPKQRGKPTRADRRVAERAAQREQARKRAQRKQTLSMPTIIGGIVTVLVVMGIIIFAISRSNQTAATQTNTGLTDPNAKSAATSVLPVGSVAPDFTMKSVHGFPYHLAAQRGHPVLIEFYATWCPVCHAEAPAVAKIFNNYREKGVRVWSVLADPYGRNFENSGRTDLRLADAGDLAWYARTFNVHFPQLVDPKFVTVNKYGIGSYPGLYIIGKDGKILFADTGQKSYAELSKVINQALGQKA